MNKMALLLEGNIGMYHERVTRVRGVCVGWPADMSFLAVATGMLISP